MRLGTPYLKADRCGATVKGVENGTKSILMRNTGAHGRLDADLMSYRPSVPKNYVFYPLTSATLFRRDQIEDYQPIIAPITAAPTVGQCIVTHGTAFSGVQTGLH